MPSPCVARIAGLAVSLVLLTGAGWAAEQAVPQVLGHTPHDTGAFTQGLLYHEGFFFESTGLYGQSTLRRVKPADGSIQQQASLPASEFGEGLARVGDRLIQLTWQEQVAHNYDLDGFGDLGLYTYSGQGWGLCHDGQRLVMSNGGSSLFFRDPDTFALQGQVQVTLDGTPIGNLNELECVGSLVYANVWLTDTILRIDPGSGVVLTEIDASGLLTPAEAAQANVLNGIAFDPSTDHFFLTGKLWPKVFEVSFPFDPYGAECLSSNLQQVSRVELGKDGASGVMFAWDGQSAAAEYHVNSVADPAHLSGPGPRRPDVPGGFGVARCDALGGATSCTDPDGLSDPEPLLFYQVFAACGPLGADEGP